MNRLKVVALLILVVLLAAPLYAQTMPARTTVNVPFDFVVGDMTMPAGDYTIVCVTQSILKITGPNGSVFVMTKDKILSNEDLTETKLIFTQQNGKHVLHQIATEGQSHVHDIVHSGTAVDIP